MSGGHFNYAYNNIRNLAEEILDELVVNPDNFSKHTNEVIAECAEVLSLAAKLGKEIEWLYSGDTGEDTFKERVEEIVI